MLQPIKRHGRQQTSRSVTMPPPVGGWNARDAIDQMPKGDAKILDNYFPRTNDLVLRNGFEEFISSGIGSTSVETLASYKSGTINNLIACANGHIYDIDSGTATSRGSGFTDNAWQHVNFNKRLFLCNGVDDPQDLNDSTLTATAWTGVTDKKKLVNVHVFNGRLMFVEKDTQSFWYGGIGAVTGALTEFDLSQVGNFGGNLIATGSISVDGGDNGIDDLFVAIMSSGEIIVYRGTDPASFVRVGVFKVAKPIGYRCFITVGSDLVMITEAGFIPLTQVMPLGRSRGDLTVSDKIRGAVNQAINSFKTNDGWEVVLYPLKNQLIFNIPRGSDTFHQYVMNTNTRAWCRFTGIDAITWVEHDGDLYFGTADGKVMQADTGNSDNGAPISGDIQCSYQYMGNGNQKKFNMVRAMLQSTAQVGAVMDVNVDFVERTPNYNANIGITTGAVWDVAVWDVDTWGGAFQTFQEWKGVNQLGYAAGLRFRTQTDSQDIIVQSITYVFENAGIL